MPRPRLAAVVADPPPFTGRRDLGCLNIPAADLAERDPFYPAHHSDAADRDAKRRCRGCPVRWDCLEWALGTREFGFGIFGGYNPEERRAIAAKRGLPVGQDEARPIPPANVEQIRLAFRLARLYLAGQARQVDLVGPVSRSQLDNAVAILRDGPDLEMAVLDGVVTLHKAAEQARARKVDAA